MWLLQFANPIWQPGTIKVESLYWIFASVSQTEPLINGRRDAGLDIK